MRLRPRHKRISLRQLGHSVAIEVKSRPASQFAQVADLGLVVTWDRGNRVSVRLRPQWANRVGKRNGHSLYYKFLGDRTLWELQQRRGGRPTSPIRPHSSQCCSVWGLLAIAQLLPTSCSCARHLLHILTQEALGNQEVLHSQVRRVPGLPHRGTLL